MLQDGIFQPFCKQIYSNDNGGPSVRSRWGQLDKAVQRVIPERARSFLGGVEPPRAPEPGPL